MFEKLFSKKNKKVEQEENRSWPTIVATIDDVNKAIRKYHSEIPKGASLRVLVNDDATIDYALLAPYLNGIPSQMFYMSKETFELFDVPELPLLMDKVQRAVDQYVEAYHKAPVIEGDPYYKVSYLKLQDFLHERPQVDFYITSEEHLITHIKPS